MLRLLKVLTTHKNADKVTLAQRIDTFIGELTTMDPARAVALT